ncbi:MAG: peroxidase-related enzyme [Candidatus Marinimicrobia bacterium]|nr:peroxidase-related enzyme [Candidatus Neomarinimicrobiota bacterium]
MPRIATINEQNASEQVSAIFSEIEQAFGRVPNLFRTYAYHPPLLQANWHKVKRVMMEGTLSRKTKEAIAVLVSKDNGCKYCVAAHEGALNAIGVSPEEVQIIENDLNRADFNQKEMALIKLARKANSEPLRGTDDEFAELRQLEASDTEIVEALGVMELFTAFNKFLDILQVEIDS